MAESKFFYQDLKPFSTFESFVDSSHYKQLPIDWYVVVSDIKGSTQAVEKGQYKEVNLIGAASITCALNALENQDFPFVFGGDGATFCIPSCQKELIEKEMAKLIELALSNFKLELRVAIIPVSKIYQENKTILISKFEITPKRNIAIFQGGGLSYADFLAKKFYDDYKIQSFEAALDELKGVSCRWNPIPANKDCILSLLVCAREDSNDISQIYSQVIKNISNILGSSIEKANPIQNEAKSYKGLLRSLKDESAFHKTLFSFKFLARALEIIIATSIFKYKFNPFFLIYNFAAYKNSMAEHSDFRRFDDTLRLVIDCTNDQVDKLKDYLHRLYQKGDIYYGMHTSDDALMTCYVETLSQGGHLHFVDGAGGGLTMAAKAMKKQMI